MVFVARPLLISEILNFIFAQGMSNFSKPARFLFLEIQKIDSSYYPEVRQHLANHRLCSGLGR